MPLKNYLKSFGFAFSGIRSFFKLEFNAIIHLLAALVVIIAGLYFEFNQNEWLWIILAISLVVLTELFNTAIEQLCNLISEEKNPQIKIIKDISAAAVLVATIFAIVTAIIIFKSYLLS
jgi:diacylglycerol kinase